VKAPTISVEQLTAALRARGWVLLNADSRDANPNLPRWTARHLRWGLATAIAPGPLLAYTAQVEEAASALASAGYELERNGHDTPFRGWSAREKRWYGAAVLTAATGTPGDLRYLAREARALAARSAAKSSQEVGHG
jgi:hypothetical protein